MFKPHTIEQYKVFCYIEEQFEKGSVLISPDSRTALKVTDGIGDSLIFDYRNGQVVETDPRPVLSPEERKAYIKQFHANPTHPVFNGLDDIVRWWHREECPLSLQQAMNLTDELYLYYLGHDIIDDEELHRLVCLGRITEEQYLAVWLWYLDGHYKNNWFGSVGVDGTGEFYEVVLHYRTPQERRFRFYLMDEYYRNMNKE